MANSNLEHCANFSFKLAAVTRNGYKQFSFQCNSWVGNLQQNPQLEYSKQLLAIQNTVQTFADQEPTAESAAVTKTDISNQEHCAIFVLMC